jgi:hypothetical protein
MEPAQTAALFGVLLCLPTAAELSLKETGTSVRRRFLAALRQATACLYLGKWGAGRKAQYAIENFGAGIMALRYRALVGETQPCVRPLGGSHDRLAIMPSANARFR